MRYLFLVLCILFVQSYSTACTKSRDPVYVCTHPITNVDYYSPCISDLAFDWFPVHGTCHSAIHYTAECRNDVDTVTPHLTPYVRINYHRTWWGHRLRPIVHLPTKEGIYQSLNHSRGVKQDMLCIRSKSLQPVLHLLR
jgi:hypothetical protein